MTWWCTKIPCYIPYSPVVILNFGTFDQWFWPSPHHIPYSLWTVASVVNLLEVEQNNLANWDCGVLIDHLGWSGVKMGTQIGNMDAKSVLGGSFWSHLSIQIEQKLIKNAPWTTQGTKKWPKRHQDGLGSMMTTHFGGQNLPKWSPKVPDMVPKLVQNWF